ncbi:uncharacterized protein LOC115682254 isoform X2 [Syzygium oleosum]|uniref:uncharacterized protein LOC115682254 isoform X2 n=1 Tax=Syzygium oleosum TaxID=219896 RepID=UPI0024BA573C|nr:uncharacterized protein LOC115682254 isoform X2 [Syzygium oleosum]
MSNSAVARTHRRPPNLVAGHHHKRRKNCLNAVDLSNSKGFNQTVGVHRTETFGDAMRGNKATALTVAEKCKNILASNWQGHLSTIKADSKGSKGDIHSSKVKYMVKRGKPYIWVPETDMHNVNTVIDERGSLAVATPFPGPLANLLKSLKKFPSRIALTGDVLPLKDQKAQLASECLKELIHSEVEVIRESSYAVSGVLSSTNPVLTSRSENLHELLDESQKHAIYKFDIRSCTFLDGNGGTHEVDLEVIQTTKTDILAPFSAMLVDGINQSESRRRALVLFCFTYLNAPDAYMLSLDQKGFDILGKVPGPSLQDGSRQYQWRDFRFSFKEEALDIESFCRQLVEMEEEAIKKVSTYSGLG